MKSNVSIFLALLFSPKVLKQSNIEERVALQAHEDGRDYQQQFVDMLDKYTFHHDDD